MTRIATDEIARRAVEICQMDVGPNDDFDEFAESVVDTMEELGNEVERPLTFRVQIDVKDGLIEDGD